MEKKPVRLEKVFELLKEAAKTRGTHPNIEDPLPILQKNGFKKPGVLQYLKRLRDTGCVEMVHGEERNGWGIVKIILKKEAVPSAFIG
jgi:hypothetical protein